MCQHLILLCANSSYTIHTFSEYNKQWKLKTEYSNNNGLKVIIHTSSTSILFMWLPDYRYISIRVFVCESVPSGQVIFKRLQVIYESI